MVEVGQSSTATVVVSESNTAKTMKSSSLEVFATPAMCALMEEAAQAAIQPHLNDGEGSVGISLSISHDAPSPIGATITATATVVAIEGRKISFTVEAHDNISVIGKGEHDRFIINNESFIKKVKTRANNN